MEHPYLFVTSIFDMLGKSASHFAHAYPHVTYAWLVMIILIILGWLAGNGVNLVPRKAQNVFEVLISGLEEFMVTITGEEGRKYFPLAATLFLFILLSNLMGLIPGFLPPTANLNTTLALAIIAVGWTHVLGIKYHGIKYVKHFFGPVPAMIPLMLPLELIGHTARILSLSFRLFGNMFGHELVVGILMMLAGLYLAPLPIMALGAFVALVQAFVFFLLSIMYFAGAIEEAH